MNNQLVELQETLYTSKNPTRRWLHCSRRDWIHSTIKSINQSSNQLNQALEVGPGAGGYLPILQQEAKHVTASDIELDYLNYIKEKFKTEQCFHYITDDITNSNQQENSFDIILCTEVIEHIPNSQLALNELARLLKPQGRLILSTPQRYSPLELTAKIAFLPVIIQIVRFIYGEAIIETGHINLLTEKQLKEQLKNANLEIEKEYKCGFYIPFLAEFTGSLGLKIEQYLEKKLRGTYLDFLLWTQCYVLQTKK